MKPLMKITTLRSRQTGAALIIGLLLLVVGGIVALGAAGSFFAERGPREATGPRLTHTIARGELVVTVIEEGVLESSENTEITTPTCCG